MDRIDTIKVLKLQKKLAKKYNMSLEELQKLVNSPYMFTKEVVNEFDLSKDISEEEYNKLKHVFIYRKLGKLYVAYQLITKRKKQRENSIKLNNKKWKK